MQITRNRIKSELPYEIEAELERNKGEIEEFMANLQNMEIQL